MIWSLCPALGLGDGSPDSDGFNLGGHMRRLIGFLALTDLAAVLFLINGLEVFARLFYVLLLALIVSFLWAKVSLRGIAVESRLSSSTTQMGQSVEERVSVYNRNPLPKLWMEVRRVSELPGYTYSRAVSLGGVRSVSWPMTIQARRRGRFAIGPTTVVSGDPLGLFQRQATISGVHNLTVYPAVVDLPAFAVPPADLPGEGRHRRRTHFVTPNASSVREYAYGDSFNRIHWPSTARTGQLMVKEFELDPASEVWILLDLHKDVQTGEGLESTEEYGVTVAASIAKRYLDTNRSIGLMAYGSSYAILRPDRGGHQRAHIMETLALAEAQGQVPIQDLIEGEGKRFGRYTTLVIITPSGDEAWVRSAQYLIRRGAKAAVALIDPTSFNGGEGTLLALSTLVASRIPTFLVRKGDNLARALGGGGEDASRIWSTRR